MYVLLNGSFGIGKSAVARELRRVVPGAVIADPEWIGVLLQRLALRHRSDFQDDPWWRRLAIAWVRLRGRFGSPVIVPMAFTNVAYLEELRDGLARGGRAVRHFCLTAPLEVVKERLSERGEPQTDTRWAWVHRRAVECCAAHANAAFAEHVPTAGRPPRVLAEFLAARLWQTDT